MPHEAEGSIVRQISKKRVIDTMESENRTGSLNDLSSLDVLDLSIRLAADLHGFEGGVIAHGDLNTEQLLRGADGEIKLNDFNNGFVMDWNRQEQRYCGKWHGYVGGFFPLESHRGFENVTEQQYDREDRNDRIRSGIPVLIESWWRQSNTLDLYLSDLVWRCMDSDFSKRPSIFEVVEELRRLRQLFLGGKLLGRRKNDPLSK
eukprot:Nitzschia sp. Nitz4//scaffold248_size28759//4020//4694//NITZ4_008105-RA/size28759-snap-gene-0.7-mRNA-1//1//CDS//3329543980//9342//frame0